MSDFMAEMHRIRFTSGLRSPPPDLVEGAYSAPQTPSCI